MVKQFEGWVNRNGWNNNKERNATEYKRYQVNNKANLEHKYQGMLNINFL